MGNNFIFQKIFLLLTYEMDLAQPQKRNKMKTAIFPGSFDPFTRGHQAVVDEALSLFDKVIIAIGENIQKQSLHIQTLLWQLAMPIAITHEKSLLNQFPIHHYCNSVPYISLPQSNLIR